VRGGRNHIIERPRLTRLLHETSARVIMLVAPAGYGKTTLARQWLANRPHAWYQGSAASSDVAAFALGIVEAAHALLPNSGKRLREWLPTSRGLEQDLDIAAELVAGELAGWPDAAWFVIDDYHLLSSNASEQFAHKLFAGGERRLLVTSRVRPIWASARAQLYGNFVELGQNALAMSIDEARSVLACRKGAVEKDLAVLADGWPAVIGLAALAPETARVPDGVAGRLHDYFAEEIFSSLSDEARSGVVQLALLPEVTPEAAAAVIGPQFETVMNAARTAGIFVAQAEPALTLHPLLKSFLIERLGSSSPTERAALVKRTARHLLESGKWDDVFGLIQKFDEHELLPELVSRALQPLLNEGRLATIAEWVAFARNRGLSSRSLDLADAEVSFRRGLHKRAFVLANSAAAASKLDEPLQSAAYYRAGQTAYLTDDTALALQLFSRARQAAQTPYDARNALWGEFTASIELERLDISEKLRDFAEVEPTDLDSTVRVANGKLILAIRQGALRAALDEATKTKAIVDEAGDPIVRSAFWHIYGAVLILAGKYAQGRAIVDKALLEIERSGIEFARAHALISRATASIGLGEVVDAEAALNWVEGAASSWEDEYLIINARVVRARLLLEQGDLRDALALISEPWSHSPSRCMQAEYLATHAAALALNGHLERATRLADEAQARSRYLEPQFLAQWTHAICKVLRAEEDDARSVRRTYEEMLALGPADTFVFAYRLEPRILEIVAEEARFRETLTPVLTDARDSARATKHGVALPITEEPSSRLLTPREREVYSLLAAGKTNREIAATLFITETTAKVHVRNVLRKLGVRSRTEAALRAVREENQA
jgi:LuxR family maltose regulon positive regulatory protein